MIDQHDTCWIDKDEKGIPIMHNLSDIYIDPHGTFIIASYSGTCFYYPYHNAITCQRVPTPLVVEKSRLSTTDRTARTITQAGNSIYIIAQLQSNL